MRNKRLYYVLFSLGLLIVLYPHVTQHVNGYMQKAQVEQFKTEKELLHLEHISEKIETAKKCNEAIFKNVDKLPDPFTKEYSQNEYEECEDTPEAGNHYASIEIPKLSLEIPIYLSTEEKYLNKGVGQVEGSSLPVGGLNTHTVLAGHRGMGTKAMFRHLDHLQPGDIFYIYSLEEKLQYEIYNVEVILPNETSTLHINEGKDLASLITCHPYRSNSHRLVVHGERITD